MKKGRARMITICLITALLASQLLPTVPQTLEYFDSQASAERLLLSANPLHNSVPALDTSATRPVFQKMPVRQLDNELCLSEVMRVYGREASALLQLVDVRSIIKETIPQYFNGSKYKVSGLNA